MEQEGGVLLVSIYSGAAFFICIAVWLLRGFGFDVLAVNQNHPCFLRT